MVNFRISIAEITVEINALFETTKNFCHAFLTDSTPDFSVTVTEKDIEFERRKARETDIKEGRPFINFSDKYLETLAVYRKIAERLPEYNAFLFHGSAVSVDGKGYLFTAKSGTGKSTHVSFYREKFGERAVMVNDDKPLILVKDGIAYVCGSPWCGKHNLGNNIIVPLSSICVLTRSPDNHIKEVSASEVLEIIVAQSYRVQNPAALVKYMQLLSTLSDCVKFYVLGCNLDPNSAIVSFGGMNKL